MLVSDRPLVRAQQPSLQERGDAMHARQQHTGAAGIGTADVRIVDVIFQPLEMFSPSVRTLAPGSIPSAMKR